MNHPLFFRITNRIYPCLYNTIEFNFSKYSSTKILSRNLTLWTEKFRRTTKMSPCLGTIIEEFCLACEGMTVYGVSLQMNYRYVRRYRQVFRKQPDQGNGRLGIPARLVQLFEVKGRRWYIRARSPEETVIRSKPPLDDPLCLPNYWTLCYTFRPILAAAHVDGSK